ncbi:MAG: hypothetical protein IJQ21_12125 [Lachnospiraceae bacterium]|nr:hypothetical protein [Lachnospiraceae bacterium]
MILKDRKSLAYIKSLQPQFFDDMVKIVIDDERQLIAVNMEMHSDLGIELYDDGSKDQDLYGANIYYADGTIEWSSTLNIQQNRRIQNGTFGRVITHEATIVRLTGIVDRWIDRQER